MPGPLQHGFVKNRKEKIEIILSIRKDHKSSDTFFSKRRTRSTCRIPSGDRVLSVTKYGLFLPKIQNPLYLLQAGSVTIWWGKEECP
jgi:hypothetical protein